MVDSQLAGRNNYNFHPWYAALMYQLTGKVAYANYAIQRTDAYVASEEALINKKQRAQVAGDSYLYVGEHIGNVALVYDWCYDLLTPQQRTRWLAYANEAVWNVWNYKQARWGNTVYPWTGWSVDNPSNNYYYSFLRATMLLGLASYGENAQAQSWIDKFRTEKIENQLLPVFNRDLQGGGSREGTGYGIAMKNLFQLYDWWERSTGERIATRTPHTLASMAHLMHSIVPALTFLAPTGDHSRDSTVALFDYHREYLLTLISLFPQERLSSAAKSLLVASSVPRMTQYFQYYVDYLYEPPRSPAARLGDLSTAYWGAGTGQLMMRSAWDTGATFSNFICGPYTESHAHRDQGSFVIFKGNWLAYDQNMASHSGIEQSEEMHNLVRIEQGGAVVKQVYGTSCTLAALADTPHFTFASARVTPSYRENSTIGKVEREFLFLKPDTFVVFDRVSTAGSARGIWTLNLPSAATVEGDRIRSSQGRSSLDVFRIAPVGVAPQIVSWPKVPGQMSGGVRVDLAGVSGSSNVFLHVLAVNGAVASAARADSPGQTGVQIKLADGRAATVRFSTSGTGGLIELRGADGIVQFGAPLPSTVAPIPLFVN